MISSKSPSEFPVDLGTSNSVVIFCIFHNALDLPSLKSLLEMVPMAKQVIELCHKLNFFIFLARR